LKTARELDECREDLNKARIQCDVLTKAANEAAQRELTANAERELKAKDALESLMKVNGLE